VDDHRRCCRHDREVRSTALAQVSHVATPSLWGSDFKASSTRRALIKRADREVTPDSATTSSSRSNVIDGPSCSSVQLSGGATSVGVRCVARLCGPVVTQLVTRPATARVGGPPRGDCWGSSPWAGRRGRAVHSPAICTCGCGRGGPRSPQRVHRGREWRLTGALRVNFAGSVVEHG
jgi:hypothetical protein